MSFRKILIANRGEIAVRVVRACRDLGIPSVAVHSDADRTALHVLLADEAYGIGKAPAAESYLDIDRIVETARRAGADAIHPGYGFLSENADFAEACARAALTFIGPPPSAIRAMGDKVEARARMRAAGVSPVPGTESPVARVEDLGAVAAQIGFPLLIKASAGGGGKGMRLVREGSELASAFEQAKSEAAGAFGDDRVYVERYLERPRHIEVQILADAAGKTLHLGERDCSLQRRHQKVLEECPSPVVDETLRSRITALAVKAAKAVGYVGAGTIELLLDESGRFHFLEMNTRLQVEHPITELVTGVDLVTLQIRIAAGEAIAFDQEQVVLRGAALECRIYAEDPETFLPSPGRIALCKLPSGPGIRVDEGIYEGYEVPIHYDPLLVKVSAHGADRVTALSRMRRALRELRIGGIRTNVALHEALLSHEDVLSGQYHTHSLKDNVRLSKTDGKVEIAALAAAFHHHRHGAERPRQVARSGWSALPGSPRHFHLLP